MCWFSNLFAAPIISMPGQLYYVRGIGKCVIDKLYIASCNSSLKYNARCVQYHVDDKSYQVYHIEETTFLLNSELIVEDNWKEYQQYKTWLAEAKIK